MRHGNVGGLRQVLTQQVIEGAWAHAGVGNGAAGLRFFAGVVQKLIDIVDGQIFACQETNLRGGNHLHQTEVFAFELDSRDGQRCQDQFVGRALENDLTIGRCAQNFLSCNGTTGAAQVVNNDGLSQVFGQGVVHCACNDIRQTACWVRHQQSHGFAGVVLGKNGSGHQQCRNGCDGLLDALFKD